MSDGNLNGVSSNAPVNSFVRIRVFLQIVENSLILFRHFLKRPLFITNKSLTSDLKGNDMNATDFIQFTAKAFGLGIVLAGFAPVILIAWLCYFLCQEVEETTEFCQNSNPSENQTKCVFESTSSVLGCSQMAHAS